MVGAFLIGGAMAGLAGAIEMMGNVHRYGESLSNNTGYIGIVIAILAGASELSVVSIAIVFAAIAIGGSILRVGGASADLVFALFGLTLVFTAIGQGLAQMKLVRVQVLREEEDAEAPTDSTLLRNETRDS
jgi:simple sugar transport system permease protein